VASQHHQGDEEHHPPQVRHNKSADSLHILAIIELFHVFARENRKGSNLLLPSAFGPLGSPQILTIFSSCHYSVLSTPQLTGRQLGSLRQRVKLCKGETGIGEMAQTAIGAGNDVFFAD
jgi:hypothetical protein